MEPPDISLSLPVWARDDAFPEAPGGYGWMDLKGRRVGCGSMEELARQVREVPGGELLLVWTPAAARMRLPEEVDGLAEALEVARHRAIHEDLALAEWRVSFPTVRH